MDIEWNRRYKPQRKADLCDIAQTIRDTVTMAEVISVYAPDSRPRGRRIPCPIHHGKDYNFSFTQHGYRCFVCGASGDVIGFVKDVLCLSTKLDAMRRINDDLRLNLPFDGDASPSFNEEATRRRQAAERRERARAEWEGRRTALWDEWVALDIDLRSLDPHDMKSAEINKRKTVVEYLIDTMPEEPR